MTLTLRTYRSSDIPGIVEGVARHLKELPNYARITVAPDRLEYLLTHNLNGGSFQAWVLATDQNELVGGGAGYCVPGMLTWDMIANDVFLYVRPDHRSLSAVTGLVKAYRDWALAKNAKIIVASHSGGSFPEGSKEARLYDAFLKRQGFDPVGTLYHFNRF